jgi:hypothetical protein
MMGLRRCAPALLLVASCTGGGDVTTQESGSAFSIAEARAAQQPSTAADPRRRTPATEAIARVAPAVVTVQTEIVSRAPVDPFDWFSMLPPDRVTVWPNPSTLPPTSPLTVTDCAPVTSWPATRPRTTTTRPKAIRSPSIVPSISTVSAAAMSVSSIVSFAATRSTPFSACRISSASAGGGAKAPNATTAKSASTAPARRPSATALQAMNAAMATAAAVAVSDLMMESPLRAKNRRERTMTSGRRPKSKGFRCGSTASSHAK